MFSRFLLILIKDFDDKVQNDTYDQISIEKNMFDLFYIIEFCSEIYEIRAELGAKSIKIKTDIAEDVPTHIF